MTDGRQAPAAYTNPAPEDIIEWLPHKRADRRIRYGTDAQQFGDLRIPQTPAPEGGYPVVVVIHGGGYSPNWPYDHMSLLAESLTAAGDVVTWNLEYRKPGQRGGGWAGTWLDIANGVDFVRSLAEQYPLNLDRVVALGHSAGGTFVSWAAGRSALAADSDVYLPNPLQVCGVVPLAPMLALDEFVQSGHQFSSMLVDAEESSPEQVRERIAQVSPTARDHHISVPQAVIIGSLDDPGMIERSRKYVADAQTRGTEATFDYLEGANHFDMVDPRSAAWPVIAGRTLSLCGIEDSPERAQRIAARLEAY